MFYINYTNNLIAVKSTLYSKLKKALITGITGQDGAYLGKTLLDSGYTVFGAYNINTPENFWRLDNLKITKKIKMIPIDISDTKLIFDAIKISDPDEVYNLAAQSSVGKSFTEPIKTLDTTGLGVARILEVIKKFNDQIKFFQASSSEIFGNTKPVTKNESTNFCPVNPYGIAKLQAYWITKIYRDIHKLFTVNGILFNHESPLRGLEFVTRKISNGVAKISLGIEEELQLGNLSSKKDWGYAPEYTEGMWKMLNQEDPDDYILATNESHSIKEFVEEASEVAGISTDKIKSTKENFRLTEIPELKGDYSKSKMKINWSPKITFKNLVKIMVEEDITRWKKFINNEKQAWDCN